MRHWAKQIGIGVILTAMPLVSCKDAPTLATRSFSLMGTRAFISVPTGEEQVLSLATANMRATADRIHELVDIYNPKSEISRVNRVGFGYRFPISADTYRIIDYARRLSELTGGVYDITDAGLKELWITHFQQGDAEPLASSIIQAALSGVGMDKLDLSPNSIRLKTPYTQIDVTSIAQTYVLDRSIIDMRRQGWRNILVGLNHTVRCLGAESPSKPWSLEVRHPLDAPRVLGRVRLSDGAAAATLTLPDHAVSVDDTLYSTILNARTGEPSKGVMLVTVVGPVATEAYALAYALFAAGVDQAPALLQRAARYHALIVTEDDPQLVWTSHGMADIFTAASGVRATRNAVPEPVNIRPDDEIDGE